MQATGGATTGVLALNTLIVAEKNIDPETPHKGAGGQQKPSSRKIYRRGTAVGAGEAADPPGKQTWPVAQRLGRRE